MLGLSVCTTYFAEKQIDSAAPPIPSHLFNFLTSGLIAALPAYLHLASLSYLFSPMFNFEEIETNLLQTEQQPMVEETPMPVDKKSIIEHSSASDSESCGASFNRKMESLGASDPLTGNEPCEQGKVSDSDLLSVTPGLNVLIPERNNAEDVPQVTFLDGSEPSAVISTIAQPESQESVAVCTPQPQGPSQTVAPGRKQLIEDSIGGFDTDAPSVSKGFMDYRSNTDYDSHLGVEFEASSQARSTLREAL